MLREYDLSLSSFFGTEREYDQISQTLDKLEKKAVSAESWLSVLKRRRALSARHPQSLINYQRSIDRALNAFPGSAPINAIAAAAIVKDSALSNEDAKRVRQLLPYIADPFFNTLRLSFHTLLGDFKNPQNAAVVSPDIFSDGSEIISLNLTLLKTIRGDYRAAASDIQRMMSEADSESAAESRRGEISGTVQLTTSNEQSGEIQLADDDYVPFVSDWDIAETVEYPAAETIEEKKAVVLSDTALKFAAEFHYDFGSLERSAEIFSLLNDTGAMSRQADALYIAGFNDIAEYIWNMIAQAGVDDARTVPSLYNLAVIALEKNNLKEASSFLERLIKIDVTNDNARLYNEVSSILNCAQFGLIRYSRTLEMPRAAAILQSSAAFPPSKYPYIDLEICKRLSPERNLNRQASETWLLLDRHSENEELYKWAARHFYFQRMYDEIPILIDRFNILKYSSSWVNFYKALLLMNNGDLQSAETILLAIPEDEAEWYVNANLGRIYEQMLTTSRALRQYEAAAAKLSGKSGARETGLAENAAAWNKKAAARVQQRAAKGYNAQGKQSEAIKALLQAMELDPENMSIKLDLERIMY